MTYTAFCTQHTGGTTWIHDIEAPCVSEASELAKIYCARAWHLLPSDIHVLGIVAGVIEVLMWDDLTSD